MWLEQKLTSRQCYCNRHFLLLHVTESPLLFFGSNRRAEAESLWASRRFYPLHQHLLPHLLSFLVWVFLQIINYSNLFPVTFFPFNQSLFLVFINKELQAIHSNLILNSTPCTVSIWGILKFRRRTLEVLRENELHSKTRVLDLGFWPLSLLQLYVFFWWNL